MKYSLDDFRYQTRFILRLEARDTPKRVASAVLMSGILWFVGLPRAAAVIGAMIAVLEVLHHRSCARLPAADCDITRGYIANVWFQNAMSTTFYLSPAVLLAQQPSSALLMTAVLWTFGIIVHISNTFAPAPLYNWTLMTPAMCIAVIIFLTAGGTDYAPATRAEWLVATSILFVYLANTLETLTKQTDTQAELDAARREANMRLSALEHLSRHDTLTGLLNRTAFDAALGKLLAGGKGDQPVTVCLLDLDGFKPINDTYGHSAGDEVLRIIAERLQTLLHGSGVLARLGGDEFALAIAGNKSEQSALDLAKTLAHEIEKPITWQGKVLRVAVSIGVSMTKTAGRSVEALCGGADRAMYGAKADNESKVLLFDPAQYESTPSLEDRSRILEAFKNREIRPFYQPKVRLTTLETCGFEALARWVEPGGTILTPGVFIPRINELGLQGEFLAHMTTLVLRDVEELLALGLDPGAVSVNIPEIALATHSGRDDLEALLRSYPAARPHITLEITEDVFIARSADMIQSSIAQFRRAGQRISLDDFGTGFASFQHLRQLDFDELKIDASFVADLSTDPTARILVGGFLSMAGGLGVAVIAEGIETQAQLAFLRRTGCDVGQGFLFGVAMPLAETKVRLMAEQSPPAAISAE